MHYATHRWSDFVRGMTSKAITARMNEHLSTGCRKCNQVANLMRKLAITASKPELEVPSSVVHNAKAIFNIPTKRNVISTIVARLVFDSFLEPLPAGVRSRTQMFRQAMYEAGDVLIDLRMQSHSGGTCTITGQVADKTAPMRPARGIALHLVAAGDRRAVQPNRFGEFQTKYHTGQNVSLEINAAGRSIQVPLSNLSDRTDDGADPTALGFDLPETDHLYTGQ
jgi:hypothetical protein